MTEYWKPFRTTRTLENFHRGERLDWYRIENKTTGPTQVHIYDEIGGLGVSSSNFINDIAKVNGDLEVHLNTPGGEVFEGINIYNNLKQRAGNVTVVVDSLAASIGSVIAMAASPGSLIMGKNSRLMIHDGFGMGMGNAADMRKLADLLDDTSDNIASIYADRTGKPANYWRDQMRNETWFKAQDAVDAGLADAVQGSEVKNSWDLSALFSNVPGTNPPAEPVLLNASVDNSPWDGGKAMANGAAADDPAAFYAGICAGKKDGNPRNQDSWALPYKYHPGDPPNAAGVKNALARLPQTQGLTNEAAAQATLEKAMKQVNPDYEPSSIDTNLLSALLTQSLGRGK